jgi:hypothetical protein
VFPATSPARTPAGTSGANPTLAPLVVGVTSHRNLVDAEIDGLRERVRAFLAQLQRDFPGLPLVMLSSLAVGGDQLVAEEALAVGARLVAPLPFARETYLHDFTDSATRARFESLCTRAGTVRPRVCRS